MRPGVASIACAVASSVRWQGVYVVGGRRVAVLGTR